MITAHALMQQLTEPTEALIASLRGIDGDIAVLGAGGKMGPSLARLAARACREGGISKRIYAVSRFGDAEAAAALEAAGVEVIRADLLDPAALEALPAFENILYLAGRKFGTDGNEALTWAMNATLPALVARRFPSSRFVVFSSGNLYPAVAAAEGGCREERPLAPLGDYAMSVMARERAFEYAAASYGTPVLIYRLNFAVALEYGVLCDIGQQIQAGETIDLTMPLFNCIWQGDANRYALQALTLAQADRPAVLNVTGPETLSVRQTAQQLAEGLGLPLRVSEQTGERAFLSDASKCFKHFGYPRVTAAQMLEWQIDWLCAGQATLGKPTHFQELGGQF